MCYTLYYIFHLFLYAIFDAMKDFKFMYRIRTSCDIIIIVLIISKYVYHNLHIIIKLFWEVFINDTAGQYEPIIECSKTS